MKLSDMTSYGILLGATVSQATPSSYKYIMLQTDNIWYIVFLSNASCT
jgi:hypothetical protein